MPADSRYCRNRAVGPVGLRDAIASRYIPRFYPGIFSTPEFHRPLPQSHRLFSLAGGDDYFCRSNVVIPYRRCRIDYGSASRITEAKTDHGGDERAVGRKWQCGPFRRPRPSAGGAPGPIPLTASSCPCSKARPPAGSGQRQLSWRRNPPVQRLPAPTLQRRLQDWRALNGPQEDPGWTSRLGVTIGGRRYRHRWC